MFRRCFNVVQILDFGSGEIAIDSEIFGMYNYKAKVLYPLKNKCNAIYASLKITNCCGNLDIHKIEKYQKKH